MSNNPDDLRSQLINTAIAEFLDGVERDAAPDEEEFLAQHPKVNVELREFLKDYYAVGRLSARVVNTVDESISQTSSDDRKQQGTPRLFGCFELLEEIARGGMGVVYKARQTTPNRIVAIKMILAGQLATDADIRRFYAEAQAVATLDHPNIVPIFEIGEFEGQHYFTMGFVEGHSLLDHLVNGPLATREAAVIIREVAIAVHYAHQRGIIHRDLKPSNILIDQEGRTRVTDFGLARQLEGSHLTNAGQVIGTPSFMPPEQISGKQELIGPTSDVYSLGATLYALLTGSPPFQGTNITDTLRQVVEQEPQSLRQWNAMVPRDLETIALKCLEKTPERRYATAQSLADDLQRFLTDRPILGRRVSKPEHILRWCHRNPLASSLLAVVTVLVTVVLVVLVHSNVQIRNESASRANALEQKSAALTLAYGAIKKMLTEVANNQFDDVPIAHSLRIRLLQDAVEFYENLAEFDGANRSPSPEMATVLKAMATLQRELGQSEEAERSLRRGIELLSVEKYQDSPETKALIATMELDLAYTMGESLQSVRSESPEVEAQFLLALNLLRDLEQRWPDRRSPSVICFRYFAERAYKRGDLVEAEQSWCDAIANGEACLTQQGTDIATRVSLCWAYLEYSNRILKYQPARQDESELILTKGLTHAKIALEQNSRSSQALDVSAALHFSLASCYSQTNRVDLAIPLFHTATEIIQSLCIQYPYRSDYWNTLQWFIRSESRSLKKQGQTEALQNSLRSHTAWIASISNSVPHDSTTRDQLRQLRICLVDELHSIGLIQDAETVTKQTP